MFSRNGKQRKKILKINSNGFTLVEVIVTIVILGILLAGGFVSIISWQHNALYNKNNEYAQTIFLRHSLLWPIWMREEISGNWKIT